MHKSRAADSVTRGFTLLELLVVMSIIAMTTALVLPSASRWLAATRERGWQQDVHAELAGLPLRAFRDGRPLELDGPALKKLIKEQLPEAATVETAAPLRYSAVGATTGGAVKVRLADGRTMTWVVAAPTGEVTP